ncbi:tyrosine-type recombinase/integrase [Candidatus Gracilibacteria bacterium]|nr:tyrosine-type recombinase/integrase [Candidatus Gracilibacteria bacterium]
MNLIESLENFLTYLRLHKGRSMKTLEQYEFHLWRFFVFLDPSLAPRKNDRGAFLWDHREVFLDSTPEKRAQNRQKRVELKGQCITRVEDITKHDIDSFRLELSKDELSVKTINAHIITYRSWLKFLKKEQVPCIDPTILDLLKPPDREVTFLTNDEILRFFESVQRETIQGKRDYAICECIYSTGLRISELTALNQKDVNLETLEFAVRGKGNKVRVVYLTEKAKNAIQEYLQARNDTFSPLFIRHNFNEENISLIELTDTSVRLTRFFITNMIKQYGLKAGILKNLHAHTLRHSFATTLLTNGADIRIIQELLGHASITTTQVYTHVTNPKLKEAHMKFHK